MLAFRLIELSLLSMAVLALGFALFNLCTGNIGSTASFEF